MHQLRRHQHPPPLDRPGDQGEADRAEHESGKEQRLQREAFGQLRQTLKHDDFDQHTDGPHPANRGLAVAVLIQINREEGVERGVGERIEKTRHEEHTHRRQFEFVAQRFPRRVEHHMARRRHCNCRQHDQHQQRCRDMQHRAHRQIVEQVAQPQHGDHETDRTPDPNSPIVPRRRAHLIERDRFDQRHLCTGEKMHHHQHRKQPREALTCIHAGETDQRSERSDAHNRTRLAAHVCQMPPRIRPEDAHYLRNRIEQSDLGSGHADIFQIQGDVGRIRADVGEVGEVVEAERSSWGHDAARLRRTIFSNAIGRRGAWILVLDK